MPFMIPLLCVTARSGSSAATAVARTTRSAISAPLRPARASRASGQENRAEHTLCRDALVTIDISTVPPLIRSSRGRSASPAVLTLFAPIASRASRSTSTLSTPLAGSGSTRRPR